jgi:hypothetical protein
MSHKQPPEWVDFSTEVGGNLHEGRYCVENGTVTVRLKGDVGLRQSCTLIGGGTALSVARMLLRELGSGKSQ